MILYWDDLRNDNYEVNAFTVTFISLLVSFSPNDC